jgi:hypothetical protein
VDLVARFQKARFTFSQTSRVLGSPLNSARRAAPGEGSVLTVLGSSFGVYGQGYLRLSYPAAYSDLARAMVRMERVLRKDSPCSELFCILLQFVKQFGSKVSESGNEGFDGS